MTNYYAEKSIEMMINLYISVEAHM